MSNHVESFGFAPEEWKLRETRRRHIDELARLGTSSSSDRWPRAVPTEMRDMSPVSPGFHGGGAGRMVDSCTMEAEAGPVLVSCRRDFGAHRIRLWVEDLPSIGSARFHAIDEATGARMYRDIPDAALSRLLTVFRRSPTCDPDDVDDFLRAMLRACKIRMFPGGLDIALPSEQDLHPESRPAPLNLRVMQHISAMGQRPVGSHGSQASQASQASQVPKTSKAIPFVAPSVSGCSGLGVAPVSLRPPRPSKPPGHPHAGMPKRPVRRMRPQSAPHTGRIEEPHPTPSKAMEATGTPTGTPVTQIAPRNASTASTICSPKSAPHSHSVPAFRGRRARPTSAKALKHRRVVDDSVDSIIYEDDEEEQETETQVPPEAPQSPETSLGDTRYATLGATLGATLSDAGETGEGETVSESLDCGHSVDSVDCVSKLPADVHDNDRIQAHTSRPSRPSRCDSPPCAPQLCLAPSLNMLNVSHVSHVSSQISDQGWEPEHRTRSAVTSILPLYTTIKSFTVNVGC